METNPWLNILKQADVNNKVQESRNDEDSSKTDNLIYYFGFDCKKVCHSEMMKICNNLITVGRTVPRNVFTEEVLSYFLNCDPDALFEYCSLPKVTSNFILAILIADRHVRRDCGYEYIGETGRSFENSAFVYSESAFLQLCDDLLFCARANNYDAVTDLMWHYELVKSRLFFDDEVEQMYDFCNKAKSVDEVATELITKRYVKVHDTSSKKG